MLAKAIKTADNKSQYRFRKSRQLRNAIIPDVNKKLAGKSSHPAAMPRSGLSIRCPAQNSKSIDITERND